MSIINEIARMRFQGGRNPNEKGALVITEDGFLQIEPSDEFVEALAGLEEKSIKKSMLIGRIATFVFFGIGAAITLVAWMLGRIGGEMRQTLTLPRPIDEIQVETNSIGHIRVTIPGAGPQRVALEWERGEYDDDEAKHFVSIYNRFKAAEKADKS